MFVATRDHDDAMTGTSIVWPTAQRETVNAVTFGQTGTPRVRKLKTALGAALLVQSCENALVLLRDDDALPSLAQSDDATRNLLAALDLFTAALDALDATDLQAVRSARNRLAATIEVD